MNEAVIPVLLLFGLSAAMMGKVAVAERKRRKLKAFLYERLAAAMRDASADTGLLVFFDRESQELFADVAIGIDPDFFLKGKLRRGAGVSGRVLETGQPMIVDQLYDDERFRSHPLRNELKERGIASVISLPIELADRVIGVMTLSSPRPGHFTSASVPRLVPITLEIGLTIGQARIFEVTRTNWED